MRVPLKLALSFQRVQHRFSKVTELGFGDCVQLANGSSYSYLQFLSLLFRYCDGMFDGGEFYHGSKRCSNTLDTDKSHLWKVQIGEFRPNGTPVNTTLEYVIHVHVDPIPTNRVTMKIDTVQYISTEWESEDGRDFFGYIYSDVR